MICGVVQTAVVPQADRGRGVLPVLVIAAGVLVFHLALSGRYGFHRDELELLVAGREPAFGYVDRHPLAPLLVRAVTAALGEHLWPLRALAGAVHAAVVVLAAMIARELGGGRRALVLTGLTVATMPLFVATGSVLRAVTLDQLWWAALVLLILRLVNGADPRWWLAVGAFVGAGLQTRWTVVLLVACLAACLAVLPGARQPLWDPWLGAGAVLAVALWLPNLVWQAGNGWPGFDAVSAGRSGLSDDEGLLGVILRQLALAGLLALPLLGVGLVWLWRTRPWRVLAVAAGVVAVAVLAVGDSVYDLGPVYLLAIAAGAVAIEPWLAEEPERWRVAVVALAVNGLVPLAAVAPVAPVDVYANTFHDLDAGLGDEVGWPEMVDIVAAVVDVLPADERPDVRIVTATVGEAAAIDLYGPARGLPRGTALSADGVDASRWPDGEPAGTFVTLRLPHAALAPYCDALGPVAVVPFTGSVENDLAGAPVLVCRDLRVPPNELRDALRRAG